MSLLVTCLYLFYLSHVSTCSTCHMSLLVTCFYLFYLSHISTCSTCLYLFYLSDVIELSDSDEELLDALMTQSKNKRHKPSVVTASHEGKAASGLAIDQSKTGMCTT